MNSRLIIIVTFTILIIGTMVANSAPPIPTNYQISLPSYQLQNEEQIVVDPTDSLYLAAIWRDHRIGYRQVAVGNSTDGGNTWTSYVFQMSKVFYDMQSDPTMDVDKNGNFYASFMDFESGLGDYSALTMLKSTDKGLTWEGPYFISNTNEYFDDKQFVAIDRTDNPSEGNIYVVWARYPIDTYEATIAFSRSTDGALNFTAPIIIAPYLDFSYCGGLVHGMAGQFAEPFVGVDGAVYVAYVSEILDSSDCSYTQTLKLLKSIDEGISFTEPRAFQTVYGHWQLVDGGVDVYAAPASAVDLTGGTHSGNLYLVYASMDPINEEYNDYNIELVRSSDGGDNWSGPIYINDDYIGPGAMYDQFLPWMDINEEGTLVAIWYDQRTDPIDHYKFDIFAAYSFDGGASFTTNHRISEVSVDPDNLPVTRAGLIAEYIGVTIFKDHVNAVWTDTRNGDQDVFGANWVIPLLKPRLLEPGDGDQTLSNPVLRWATAWKENDDQYLLEIATDDLFTNIILSETITTSEYTTVSPLEDGIYYWRVRAEKISNAEISEYSSTFEFTVDTYLPPVPALISPADETISLNDYPEFEWDPGEAPSSDVYYDLLISADETFTDETITRRYEGLTTTTFITPDILYTDTVYYWTVSAENWAEQTVGFADAFSYELVYYICADVDGQPGVNILDIVFLINYKYKDGSAPDPLIAGEVDGIPPINILDIVYLINYKYKNGPDPICE